MKSLCSDYEVSERRACKVIGQPRSSQRYKVKPRDDEASLTQAMRNLARKRPRFGYRRIGRLLRKAGWQVSDTRMFRLWRREGLKVPQKKRKKRHSGSKRHSCDRLVAERKDHVWAWDFVFCRTAAGSTLKWLVIIDEFTRESLSLTVSRRITSEDVINTLAELFATRGAPKHIRSDNGPELTANALKRWLCRLDVQTLYIEPGSPWQNGYAESFNSRFRDEFLATEVFDNVKSAKLLTEAWRTDYNHYRPHSSLGYQTPAEFATLCAASAPTEAAPQSPLQHHTAFP